MSISKFSEPIDPETYLYDRRNSLMSDQQWDVLEFVRRLRDGELDGHLGEAFDLLTPEQLEELERLLLRAREKKS